MICPICENQNGKFQLSHLLGYLRCEVCGGHFISHQIEASYPQVYFEQNLKPSLIARIAMPLLDFFYYLRFKRIKKILKNKTNAKVLDYGCGAGKLVEILIKKGINATGFEPSKGARNITQKKNLPVYGEVKFTEGGYDLIMFWHSLEHISNPLEVMRKIKSYLAENGKIMIAVPNAASFEAYIGRRNWFHYLYPLHRVQFTSRAIKLMLKKIGLKITEIDFFNPEHTVSGLIQTFLHFFMPKYAFYGAISHRQINIPVEKAIFFVFPSLILLIIFSPILILFFLIQLIFKKTGAMIIIAERM